MHLHFFINYRNVMIIVISTASQKYCSEAPPVRLGLWRGYDCRHANQECKFANPTTTASIGAPSVNSIGMPVNINSTSTSWRCSWAKSNTSRNYSGRRARARTCVPRSLSRVPWLRSIAACPPKRPKSLAGCVSSHSAGCSVDRPLSGGDQRLPRAVSARCAPVSSVPSTLAPSDSSML